MPSRFPPFAQSSSLSLGRLILRPSTRSLQRYAGRTILALSLLLSAAGCSPSPPPSPTQVPGEAVAIDRLYPPATGPSTNQTFTLLKSYPQKVWLTGVDIAVKDQTTDAPVKGVLSAATVGFQDVERHRQLNALDGPLSPSLFHPGPELTSLELPDGYGIPLQSNEQLYLSAIWQNRDLYRPPLEARLDATLHFAPDTQPPPKELRVHPVFATVPEKSKDQPRPYDKTLQLDGQGKAVSARWLIPSGASEAHSLVSYQLPAETTLTVRYLSAFVYDDWTYLELTDLTTGASLVRFTPGAPLTRTLAPPLTLDSRHRLELKVGYKNPAASDHVGAGMLVLYTDP